MVEKEEKNRKSKIFYILLLALIPVIWGYGFIVTEDALLAGMGPFFLLACRFLIAGFVLMTVHASLSAKKTLVQPFQKGEWIWGIVLGGINFVGYLLQTVGMRTTDPARTGMLTGTYVILVPLLTCFIYKKLDYKSIINAVVFFIGMLFLTDLKGTGGVRIGDILCLFCSIFFAMQILCIDRFGRSWNVLNFNVVQMFSMGVMGLVGSLILEWETLVNMQIDKVIFPVLYLGLLSSAFCYIVQTVSQRKLSASLVAIFLSLESVMAVVFSLAFARTDFTIPLLIGTVIMLGASISATVFDVDQRDLPKKEKKV